jgi:hypothetical protein
VNATATQNAANATATAVDTATQAAVNATATQIAANATATAVDTATQAALNATATQNAANATATAVDTATQAAVNATATKNASNATATQVAANATATQAAVNATATQIAADATATASVCAQPVTLGTAGNYGIMAYSMITNSGASTVYGSIGLKPGTEIDGGIVVLNGGVTDANNPAIGTAETALSDAYTKTANLVNDHTITAGLDIGGETLFPGIYKDTGVLNIGSNLTLDGQGNSCAVFVFQVAGNLNATVAGVHVNLIGNANAANVYWQVAGVTSLGASVSFVGNIMDYDSITFGSGAVLTGRALAENGDVTLLGNTITMP